MNKQQQPNTRSQPAPRVGNLSRGRRDVGPDTMGLGKPRSRTQQNQSHDASSRRGSSSPPIASQLGRAPKRPRKGTIQTTAYTEPETETSGLANTQTVHLSDDSSDEYQISRRSDETGSDTELDGEGIDIADGAGSRRGHGSQVANRKGDNRAKTVRISTTSGSQEIGRTRRTTRDLGRIIRSRAYSPPMFPSTSDARLSSPPGSLYGPASGTLISSPAPHSRRNMVMGTERPVLEHAKTLILRYTLFEQPLPNVVALTAQVHKVWDSAVASIADVENIEPSDQCISLVSGLR
jgi:hypothetical protein